MRFYTVHGRPDGGDPVKDTVFVKQGFCWPAFFFRWLWAFATGLWLEGLVILGIELVLALIVAVIGVDPLSSLAIAVGWYVLLGSLGNDLRRWNLGRRRFSELGAVGEKSLALAERRYFEAVAGNPATEIGAVP